MIQQILRRFLSLFLSAVLIVTLLPVISVPALAAVSGELQNLSNRDIHASYSGDDEGTWTADSNRITGSVKSTDDGCGTSDHDTTLTLTNNKDTAAILSFDYKVTLSGGTIQVEGRSVTEDGSYEVTLVPGGSIKIYLKSGDASNDTKIEITDLSLFSDTSATVTFQPAENGSYTVDGTPITEDTAYTDTSAKAYALTATPDSGYKFLDWYSDTAGSLGTSPSTSLNFDSDQTVTARFVPAATPVFRNGGRAFTDLNEACASAESGSDKIVLLISDGTLPEGEYTIPAGVTLLIPFDEQGTCYTTEPGTIGNSYKTPTEFRRLTMAPGAHITVDGAVSVSAQLNAAAGGGDAKSSTSGPYGRIVMMDGSSMTVNGSLYTYGYITGDGSITIQSNAQVHEIFEIREFRGGGGIYTMSGGLIGGGNEHDVFPVSQYYIQNVEVPMTLYAGATLQAHGALFISTGSITTRSTVTVIGTENALFRLQNGSLTKRYIPEKDRCQIDVDGDMSISNITLEASTGLASVTINSSDYILPINGHFDINLLSGKTSISENAEFLPGVNLTIAQEAELEVAAGKSLYIYDGADWGTNFVYSNKSIAPAAYSPTRTYTRKAADVIDALVDVNGKLTVNGAVYTTSGGANITSSEKTGTVTMAAVPGTASAVYQATTQSGSMFSTKITYATIPITSAMLHNGAQYAGTENEYTATANAVAGDTYQFCEYCQKWYKVGGHTVVTFFVDGAEPVTACAENGTVTCPVAAKPIKVTVRTPEGDALDGAEDSWADGTLTITGLYLNDKMPDEVTVTVVTQAVAQIVQSDGTTIDDYATLADAVANFNGETQGYIQLLGDVTESVTIDKAVRLDLAGYDVNGEVTITGDGTLCGMDSSSDGYAAPTGSITTVTGGTPVSVVETTGFKSSDEYAFFRYLAIAADDRSWSFHRFNISVTGYRFELAASSAPECALFFIARFSGDELVRNQLQKIEITMTEDENEIKGPVFTGEATAAEWEKTETGYLFEAHIVRAFSDANDDRYDKPIGAYATVTFKGDESQESVERELSYSEAWNDALKTDEQLDEAQREKLEAFLRELNLLDGTE